ncbi:MAG TPA: LysM peptidoglycan-binding domain-containing protein, partial [Afifellaceae bacterium]|nr:LysM peptidoglycan-binding domain-containing protein [Afifellaceae bacterium]
GDQPAAAGTAASTDDAAAKGENVAALTPQTKTDPAASAAPQGEAGATPEATSDASGSPNLSDAAGSAVQPSFDIVRVEPSGDVIVAGRSVPDAKVELLSNGSVIAATTADASGEFVLVLETPLAAGGHDLALRTSGGEGVSVYSKTNVAVAVPEDPNGEVLVVMNEPGAASRILAKPDEATSADVSTETAAEGETVIAVAPSVKIQMATPEAPVADDMPDEQRQAAEVAESAASGEPDMAETATTAPESQVAEAPQPAPTTLEPQPQVAEASPATPEPPAQVAEAVTAAPAALEPPAQAAADAMTDEKPPEDEKVAAEVVAVETVPLGVEAVEVEGGTLYAAGTATPGEIIRVYVDDALAGETKAFDNGRWLVETEADIQAGTVIVRADQLAPERASVVARAEVPFTKRLDTAVLVPSAKSGAPGGTTAAGELPNPNSVIIRRGDNLWTISRRTYGRGIRYTTIYTANKDQIRNPHLIFPGQVFMLPVSDRAWTQ